MTDFKNKYLRKAGYRCCGIAAIVLASMSLTACGDFLDKQPDERKELETENDVVDLLKGSYPEANYQFLCELSSDNLIDNNAPHLPSNPNDKQIENHYNYATYSSYIWHNELFRFAPATTATWTDSDSPGRIWSEWFYSIACTNHVLETIDRIAGKQGLTSRAQYGQLSARLRAAYAEALLLRAYDHFVLTNIFAQAYKDESTSAQETSIPYVTETESTVFKDYKRLSVKEVYDRIIADLEEALRYMSDSYFEAPKYHFNTQAAHALAARVYLYHHDWDKCIEHANAVLGTDDTSLLRMCMDYSVFEKCASAKDYANAWQDPGLNNNLLILNTYSTYARAIFGYRYSVAGEAASNVLMVRTNSQLWRGYIATPISLVSGMLFSSSSHDYGFFSCKIQEQFELTDKIAQTGYVHQMIRAFTSMGLLLERAEAYIMKNDLVNASHDLQAYWNNSIETFSEKDKESFVKPGYIKYMDDALLKANFTNDPTKDPKANCLNDWDFMSVNISPSVKVSAAAVPYMNCLNDFRRFETSFEGMRFFDLKRWGMEWTHYMGNEKTPYVMKGIDERRAIEAPWEALANGAGSSREPLPSLTRNFPSGDLQHPVYEKFRTDSIN